MKYRMCKTCVMDTTDPDIKFIGDGCNNCHTAIANYRKVTKEKQKFKSVIRSIRKAGKGNKYDCVIGLSGGVDSTYVAYISKKLNLRPLAVHFDNGWNSELAVQNIHRILEKLNIDLYTYVVDWEEFRDIQLSFLKASTPDCEIPTDHAIYAVLYKTALKYGIKYILDGCNIETESVLPRKWSYGHGDWTYIKNIQKEFGTERIKTFPYYTKLQKYIYEKIFNIKRVHILNYVPYKKNEVMKIIKSELGWRDYGGKHGESFYTKFYQNYILSEKFGYDKRKIHLSGLIISGQITREEALKILETPIYKTIEEKEQDIDYFCEKMQITRKELDKYMKLPNKTYWDYQNYENDVLNVIWEKIDELCGR